MIHEAVPSSKQPSTRRPLVMGILNVTPDSFSDGGAYQNPAAALDAAKRMLDEGADIVDVGGESTRPDADPVPLDEELRRTIPVLEALNHEDARVSIDTSKAAVAREALAAGAWMVNDVTAFRDPEMARVCAESGCEVCLMHMQGNPKTMQKEPRYKNVVAEVRFFLHERAEFAEAHGVPREKIWIDPGIGFGKTVEHNLALVRNLGRLVETGYPVLIGVSRKGFIGRVLGEANSPAPVSDRLAGSLTLQIFAQLAGARCIRTHDVRATVGAIKMVEALGNA